MGAHPFFGPLSQRGLNPIKPVYDPDWPDGRLNLTASAFNQLGQYTSSPGAGATATQNSPFSSLAVAVTIASTHCAYPRRDGQAELAWVDGYVMRQFTCPKASVTHPSTNRARCRATALIKTNALPLHQTATLLDPCVYIHKDGKNLQRLKSPFISETVQHRPMITVDH